MSVTIRINRFHLPKAKANLFGRIEYRGESKKNKKKCWNFFLSLEMYPIYRVHLTMEKNNNRNLTLINLFKSMQKLNIKNLNPKKYRKFSKKYETEFAENISGQKEKRPKEAF